MSGRVYVRRSLCTRRQQAIVSLVERVSSAVPGSVVCPFVSHLTPRACVSPRCRLLSAARYIDNRPPAAAQTPLWAGTRGVARISIGAQVDRQRSRIEALGTQGSRMLGDTSPLGGCAHSQEFFLIFLPREA